MMIMGQNSLKRQRLPISRHVCMFSHSEKYGEDGDEYQLYFLDLDLCGGVPGPNTTHDDPIIAVDDVHTHVIPDFRFDGHNNPRALCLLGSTLFLFEGYDPLSYRSNHGYHNRGKSALRFELESEDSDLVERHRVCDMHTSKCCPRAIPTPDAKNILVFSSQLIYDRVYREEDLEAADADFELYDPWTDHWVQLPELLSHEFLQDHQPWDVVAYSFLDEHLFFVLLSSRQMFVLDLESLEKGWDFLGGPYGRPQFPCNGYFPTINNKFVFTSERICDVREVGLSREAWEDGSEVPSVLVPQSSFPPIDVEDSFDLLAGCPSMTILHHDTDNGVVHWCALKSQSVPYTEDISRSYTRLLIDVYVTHLNAKKLNTKIIRTLQLLTHHHRLLLNLEFVPTI